MKTNNPPQESFSPHDVPGDTQTSDTATLPDVQWNAILIAGLLVCGLPCVFRWHSTGFYSFDTRLFARFLLCGVPSVLLLLYALLIGLTARQTGSRDMERIGPVVSLILTVPLGSAFFFVAFCIHIYRVSAESPLAFLLVGMFVLGFAAFLVACLIFYLLNLPLVFFSRKASYRKGVGIFGLRLLLSLLLLGTALGVCHLHLDWWEYRYQQYVNNGECKILTLMAPHELLLLDRSNRLFVLNPEEATLTPITSHRISQRFPEIARDLREQDYDSIGALASSWLKKYPGYPNIDLTATSPDNRWKMTTDNQGTSLLTDGIGKFKPIRLYHGIWVACQAFTPDGKYVLIQGNRAHIVFSDEPIKLDRIIVWRVPDWTPQVRQVSGRDAPGTSRRAPTGGPVPGALSPVGVPVYNQGR